MNRTRLLDSLVVLFLACVLILPLFRLKYLDNWPSIESTFIADSRMVKDHWPHPNWQPLWYCGTRFDYVYPPALRYGPAILAKTAHLTTARAYHMYTAILYVLGILAVYWMVTVATGSRLAAWIAAAGTALLSPSFLFLPILRIDSGYWIPQRLHVLMSYGEGPHISAVSILSAASMACWAALRKWRPVTLAAAGLLCALVVANNFYGATSLAITFSIMAWVVWAADRDLRVLGRACGIVALAYGLSAFWLTPSYLQITLINMKWVSQPGNTGATLFLAFVMAVFAGFSLWWGYRQPGRSWTLFVAGLALILGLSVPAFYYFGIRMFGESGRLVPELDFALILVMAEIVRLAWMHGRWRIPATVFAALMFIPAFTYLQHAWYPFPKAASVENSYDYRITKWAHDALPGQRVLTAGTVRFWFDAWYDNTETDGGSSQGMLNQIIPAAMWQLRMGTRADLSVLWLQALATDAAIVAEEKSLEYYRDYLAPAKFRGLPVLFDDLQGTKIYRIPRLRPGIVRVVDKAAMQAAQPIRGGDDPDGLSRYVAIVEDPKQSQSSLTWRGFDDADIEATAAPGQSVLVQETYDPNWHAYEGTKALPIRREPVMGFMLIDVPEGYHKIKIHFDVPLENRVGQVLWLVAAGTVLYCMKELFTKKFWLDAKRTFEDAQKHPPAVPEPKPEPTPEPLPAEDQQAQS